MVPGSDPQGGQEAIPPAGINSHIPDEVWESLTFASIAGKRQEDIADADDGTISGEVHGGL